VLSNSWDSVYSYIFLDWMRRLIPLLVVQYRSVETVSAGLARLEGSQADGLVSTNVHVELSASRRDCPPQQTT
jgi:hypothetical protein